MVRTRSGARRIRTLLIVALVASAFASLGLGCTTVKPWDREMLSRQDMAFDSDPMETARRNHVFFSKEATPPGGGGGGGGCGCN